MLTLTSTNFAVATVDESKLDEVFRGFMNTVNHARKQLNHYRISQEEYDKLSNGLDADWRHLKDDVIAYTGILTQAQLESFINKWTPLMPEHAFEDTRTPEEVELIRSWVVRKKPYIQQKALKYLVQAQEIASAPTIYGVPNWQYAQNYQDFAYDDIYAVLQEFEGITADIMEGSKGIRNDQGVFWDALYSRKLDAALLEVTNGKGDIENVR